MCELCMKHGAGKKWYLNAQHYSDEIVEKYNLRDYLMEQYKTPEQGKRLSKVVMAAGAFGRPMVASPGIPADRVKMLREAFAKATKDPEFIEETKKRNFDLEPASGEEMETLAKEVMSQPPEIVEKMKKLLGM